MSRNTPAGPPPGQGYVLVAPPRRRRSAFGIAVAVLLAIAVLFGVAVGLYVFLREDPESGSLEVGTARRSFERIVARSLATDGGFEVLADCPLGSLDGVVDAFRLEVALDDDVTKAEDRVTASGQDERLGKVISCTRGGQGGSTTSQIGIAAFDASSTTRLVDLVSQFNAGGTVTGRLAPDDRGGTVQTYCVSRDSTGGLPQCFAGWTKDGLLLLVFQRGSTAVADTVLAVLHDTIEGAIDGLVDDARGITPATP